MGRGLIPTHAGKTERRDRCLHPPRAHPRSRGENATLGPNRCPVSGSSPLTRGKLSRVNKRLVGPGLIPAHAGKTLTDCLNCCAEGAHPRSRGENAHVDMATPLPSGSSPLTRGKHVGHADSLAGGGLIPAHAGKTPIHTRVYAYRRAHPRSRGENRPPVRSRASWAGSSPLTRGKLGDDISLDRPHGLIPAHAGKTCRPWSRTRPRRAHPRSRGENLISDKSHPVASGSSPLTRGKRRFGRLYRKLPGLIPAHAGKTEAALASDDFPGAHPRSRGENQGPRLPGPCTAGSSPLTRGKPP